MGLFITPVQLICSGVSLVVSWLILQNIKPLYIHERERVACCKQFFFFFLFLNNILKKKNAKTRKQVL